MEQKEFVIARQIEDDHRQLKQCLNALTQTLSEDVEPKDYAAWKLNLLLKLRDFQCQMLKHFDLEEDGGFMADVLQVAPYFHHRVENLREEHKKLVSDLNHILSVVKSMESPTEGSLQRLQERVQQLMDMFKAHETTEGELLQAAYYRDYGIGD